MEPKRRPDGLEMTMCLYLLLSLFISVYLSVFMFMPLSLYVCPSLPHLSILFYIDLQRLWMRHCGLAGGLQLQSIRSGGLREGADSAEVGEESDSSR